MSVKSFKFVSPGVFINEIDNSERSAVNPDIGPVIIGRSKKGIAMQPVTVESFSEFLDVFGDTVPGRAGGDVYRGGNYQSPMYGTYAAKAFLRADVAPVTYIRLLGQETAVGSSAGGDAAAGWKTTNSLGQTANPFSENATSAGGGTDITVGGAYGLWVFPSGSQQNMCHPPVSVTPGGVPQTKDGQAPTEPSIGGVQPNAGILAAIWYMNSGSIELTGALRNAKSPNDTPEPGRGTGIAIASDSNGVFTAIYIDSDRVEHTVQFGFDDNEDTFIRKRFNTNPQLLNASGTFYATQDHIFLGESFEDNVRDYMLSGSTSMVGQAMHGVIYGIALSGTATTGPHAMKGQPSREAVAGWFIGQDLAGDYASYKPAKQQKLFRLKGRGHGEWLHKNVKVSIEKIRASTSTTSDYGTFSVVFRDILDHDGNTTVLERFDNLTLDPSSANFIARVIGDRYHKWDSTQRRLKQYGDYENRSAYVYVEMNEEVEVGATDPLLLPFGYFGPPGFTPILSASGQPAASGYPSNKFIILSGGMPQSVQLGGRSGGQFMSGGTGNTAQTQNGLTASLYWPVDRVRLSASDGGISDPTKAYFGFQNTRTSGSTTAATSYTDMHRLLYSGFVDDPVAGDNPALNPSGITGVDAWTYVFSLDDVAQDSDSMYFHRSGSRLRGQSVAKTSYETLLNAGYNRFTAPFWGGFDGFDIQKPDPLYNKGMTDITNVSEDNSYAYHTYKRAIDTVADPEYINMNVLAAPGLTVDGLTEHMINTCTDRADALALIDLANVYLPSHEAYYNSKDQRIATTPTNAANALRDRRLDSSYGATFYPWVQTRDSSSGRLLWIPPSVAMMGVLASSEKASELWFAPAGFNRGGLSDGAAGIPITNVSERLTSDDRDTLYESRINPIASFPSSGIVVFGQKTLQESASALDRINVRRLVIYLKKQISILSNQVLFEQNVSATWLNFKSLVEPLLANTMATHGISDYKLILDSTTTTPDLIDQNILYAKIMVKPTRAIEYIAIDFVVMSSGASFDD
jgi:hypothetical protein